MSSSVNSTTQGCPAACSSSARTTQQPPGFNAVARPCPSSSVVTHSAAAWPATWMAFSNTALAHRERAAATMAPRRPAKARAACAGPARSSASCTAWPPETSKLNRPAASQTAAAAASARAPPAARSSKASSVKTPAMSAARLGSAPAAAPSASSAVALCATLPAALSAALPQVLSIALSVQGSSSSGSKCSTCRAPARA
mmetsp:Transcript_19233/g.57535  ORF Transcript_19233/g.57535 Transcript_19233/m.57535 type:complete len:200 (-) Transcript_19233:223-822(-)